MSRNTFLNELIFTLVLRGLNFRFVITAVFCMIGGLIKDQVEMV